jgi:hypothetical protein
MVTLIYPLVKLPEDLVENFELMPRGLGYDSSLRCTKDRLPAFLMK